MTTPDPITPERVTLTEDERAQRTYEAVEGPMFSVPAVERILADRLRAASEREAQIRALTDAWADPKWRGHDTAAPFVRALRKALGETTT